MKLSDLFRPKWQHSDYQVRLTAIKDLMDQKILATVAKNDSDAGVREAAVHNLSTQAVLAEIAKNDRDGMVRGAAAHKLTDQAILAEIAKTDRDANVRRAAIANLSDQTLLAEIAETDSDASVRRAARAKYQKHYLTYSELFLWKFSAKSPRAFIERFKLNLAAFPFEDDILCLRCSVQDRPSGGIDTTLSSIYLYIEGQYDANKYTQAINSIEDYIRHSGCPLPEIRESLQIEKRPEQDVLAEFVKPVLNGRGLIPADGFKRSAGVIEAINYGQGEWLGFIQERA